MKLVAAVAIGAVVGVVGITAFLMWVFTDGGKNLGP